MDNSQLLLAAPMAALVLDVSNYGIKEWLAIIGSLLGTGGSVYGAWRTYRYSKSQIAKRLEEHLTDEEEAIKEARNHIIRNIRYGQPLAKEPDHTLYNTLRDAISELDRGASHQAERQLNSFAELLSGDRKVGQKYVSNINLQTATVYLLVGKIAKDRAEPTAARTAWTSALKHYDKDAEAARYLGELALASGEADEAWELFAKAVDFAPDDKLLLAETSELKAKFHRERGNPKLELGALIWCAAAFADEGLHDRAAAAYARAGTIAADLGQSLQAPRLLRDAFHQHSQTGDRDGMRAMKAKLEGLGDDVSDLPSFEQPARWKVPWFWIRLTLEFSILGAAAYLFFFIVR